MADLTKAAPQELTATLEEVVLVGGPTSTRRSWASSARRPSRQADARSSGKQG